MPSPFPGMDPWLENPLFFSSFHNRFVVYLCEVLKRNLPPSYYVDTGERVWVEYTPRYIEPDATLLRTDRPSSATATATLPTRTTPVIVRGELVANDETTELFLEVLTRRNDDEQIVAVIEVLSPANKSSAGTGLALYRKKQREVLAGRVHLIEIDLLRGGEHTTAVQRERLREAAGEYDYHVCVNAFDHREEFVTYPFPLTDRLPEIAVPLLPGEGAVPLDLQAAFDRTYDNGPFPQRVRYATRTPEPPLTPEQAAWADARLRAAGLLPPA